MGDISIKGKSPILRQGYKKGGTVKVRDINKVNTNFISLILKIKFSFHPCILLYLL